MSLSNLNDVQSMSAKEISSSTEVNNANKNNAAMGNIDAKFGMDDSAPTQNNETEMTSLAKFPIKYRMAAGKFPCNLESSKKCKKSLKQIGSSAYEKDEQILNLKKFIVEKRILEKFSCTQKKFPLSKDLKQSAKRFPLKFREENFNELLNSEIKENQENILETTFKSVHVALSELEAAADRYAINIKEYFPYIKQNFRDFNEEHKFPISNNVKSCEAVEIFYKNSDHLLPIKLIMPKTPTAPERNVKLLIKKFPIIKKQFVNFPTEQHHEAAMPPPINNLHKNDDDDERINHPTDELDLPYSDDDLIILTKEDKQAHNVHHHHDEDIQGQTLNLNAQSKHKNVEVEKAMATEVIKHQQAENFNDASKLYENNDDDAMNLMKNLAKNIDESQEIFEQNICFENLKRDDENMSKLGEETTKQMRKLRKKKAPTTLSKNFANKEQSSATITIEHSFVERKINKNNAEYYSDNNHQQQPPPQQQQRQQPLTTAERSEQLSSHSQISDVRDTLSELEEEQQQPVKAPHEGILNASTNVDLPSLPLPAAVNPIHASAFALAVSEQHSAAPNIDQTAVRIHHIIKDNDGDDDDDYVVVASDVNDFEKYLEHDEDRKSSSVECEFNDILTDVIDLIEQTTNALLITGHLLTDVQQRKQIVTSETDIAKEAVAAATGTEKAVIAKEMTVTKAEQQQQQQHVGGDRQKSVEILSDKKLNAKLIDEMKPNVLGKNVPPSTLSRARTPETPTLRMNDVARSKLPTSRESLSRLHETNATPRMSDIERTATASSTASRRDSLTRLHESSSSFSNKTAAPTLRMSDASTKPSAIPLANTRSMSSDMQRLASQDSLESVLPERTRLRRQRRMRSQDSTEEKPEDVIERLNKLKARISGALSEVKGVLKQYSTESETDAGELQSDKPSTLLPRLALTRAESAEKSDSTMDGVDTTDAAPVAFRFVRKVRRRSIFNEEDEYKTEEDAMLNSKEEKSVSLDKTTKQEASNDATKETIDKSLDAVSSKINVESKMAEKPKEEEQIKEATQMEAKILEKSVAVELVKQEELKENSKPNIEEKESNLSEKQPESTTEINLNKGTQLKQNAVPVNVAPPAKHIIDDTKTADPSSSLKKLQFLNKVQQELNKKTEQKEEQEKWKSVVESKDDDQKENKKIETTDVKPKTTASDEPQQAKALESVAEDTTKESSEAAKESATETTKESTAAARESATEAATTKPKKKIVKIVKTSRRASIAAVEGSKIEPAVQSAIPIAIKTQRRPSDSEAIFKRKKNDTAPTSTTTTTSGSKLTSMKTTSDINGEELPTKLSKLSGSKVRRASVKGVTSTVNETEKCAITESNKIADAAAAAAMNEQMQQKQKQLKVEEGTEQATNTTKPTATTITIAKTNDDVANNSNKDVPSTTATTTATTTKTTLVMPTAITTIKSPQQQEQQQEQLKIDGNRVNDVAFNKAATYQDSAAAAATAAVVDVVVKDTTKSAATIESIEATNLGIDAKNTSPTLDSKLNGHSTSERISEKLAELVGETIVVAAKTTTNITAQDKNALIDGNEKNGNILNSIKVEIKEPIHQQVNKIPTAVNKQQAPSDSTQPAEQQVAVASNENANANATNNETTNIAFDNIEASVASKGGVQKTQIAQPVSNIDEAAAAVPTKSTTTTTTAQEDTTKVRAAASANNSVVAHIDAETSLAAAAAAAMPELQVSTGPVQPVKLSAAQNENNLNEKLPFDVGSTDAYNGTTQKKKVLVKKLVRRSSLDKSASSIAASEKSDANKLSNLLKDKNKISGLAATLNKNTPPKRQPPKLEEKQVVVAVNQAAEEQQNHITNEVATNDETTTANDVAVAPEEIIKKPRKIKKKVIIKRQKRRLSISDTFFQQPEEEPKIPEIETIEKAIAYCTDDESNNDAEEENSKDVVDKPLKSCLHVREYNIGDLVLYAERFRKTLVKWKRGRVLERITSISYKLEIEGKEVPAHVSYIKKWTGRRVNFGGKEYLEIDYEQVAEEERRARSYSIWNMV